MKKTCAGHCKGKDNTGTNFIFLSMCLNVLLRFPITWHKQWQENLKVVIHAMSKVPVSSTSRLKMWVGPDGEA